MHDHLEESNRGDADMFEVMRVLSPWAGCLNSFLLGLIVRVEGVPLWIDKFYSILEL